jgi:hypothetical protein
MELFLSRLFETGEIHLPRANVAGDHLEKVTRLLKAAETIWRRGVPGEPPKFAVTAAEVASRLLFSMCHAVVYRETEVDDLKRMVIDAKFPKGDVAVNDLSLHYSVDLLFRFMPQVIERAKRISQSDELIPLLLDVLKPWPLSSIGVSELSPAVPCPSLQVIQSDRSLWQMYIDRVMAFNDVGRLQNPQIRAAVVAAIGPFDELAPDISRRLKA